MRFYGFRMPETPVSDSAHQDSTSAQLARAIEQLSQSLSARPAPEEPKKTEAEPQVYTRAQLKQYVEQGQLSEEQMEQYLDQQRERQLERKLTEKLTREISQGEQHKTIQQRIKAYTDAKPELLKTGSEERTAIQKRYAELVEEMGLPTSTAAEREKVELLALREVYGGPESLRPVQETTGRRETKRTASGSNRSSAPDKSDPLRGLTPGHRSYFESRITHGEFKGFEDPKLQRELSVIRARQEARA